MRVPNNIPDFRLDEQTRCAFIYTDTEQDQKIEISVDGDADVCKLLEMFERFLKAVGFDIPPDSCVGIATVVDSESEQDEE